MNVGLDSVITDITGVRGQRILRAIIDGERDPHRLATLRDGRIKASSDTIAAALQGTLCEEHPFGLTQAMQHFDILTEHLVEMWEPRTETKIDNLTPPDDGSDRDQLPGTPDASRSGQTVSKDSLSKAAGRLLQKNEGVRVNDRVGVVCGRGRNPTLSTEDLFSMLSQFTVRSDISVQRHGFDTELPAKFRDRRVAV